MNLNSLVNFGNLQTLSLSEIVNFRTVMIVIKTCYYVLNVFSENFKLLIGFMNLHLITNYEVTSYYQKTSWDKNLSASKRQVHFKIKCFNANTKFKIQYKLFKLIYSTWLFIRLLIKVAIQLINLIKKL